ncbi:MAG: hypothetical protein K0U36_05470 [Alphaproteobacteria bacterium]|nr:hypothetical protein [Alphaproteobacteria bacterium]
MQKKFLLATSALLATGLAANVAMADGHSWSITGELVGTVTLAAPAKADNGSGFYKDFIDSEKGAPNFPDVADDGNNIDLTVSEEGGASATIDLVAAANGAFDGSFSMTGDNGLTFSGAADSNFNIAGDFGTFAFNGDSAMDRFEIDGNDAAVGIGGAANAVTNTNDAYSETDGVTYISSVIAGGATVAVSLLNVYDSAQYVSTGGAFELKEAGAIDIELAAKYETGPIAAFFGFATQGGSLAIGAKYTQGAISAAFGFSQAATVVSYAALPAHDTTGDGTIDADEISIAVARAASAAGETIRTSAAAATGDNAGDGAKVIAVGYVAAVEAVAATTDVEAVVAVAEVAPTTAAELNQDWADANKLGGIALSVGYTMGDIGASFGMLIPANSDKYSLDTYKAAGDNPNTTAVETTFAQDVNTAAPTIAINLNYNLGAGSARVQILSEEAGPSIKTGAYVAF